MTKTAILFPGQGSQEKNMGRDAAEASTLAMDLWKLAEKESGLPLREIYWDGRDEDMADTRALQPALTAVNVNLWFALRGKLRPAAAAGHSLGEFSALVAAGALGVEDTVRAVCLRGKLMAGAGREGHGMAAVVKLAREAVEDIVARAVSDSGRELRVANYNSPAQFVISGEKPALDRAAELVKEAKGRAIPLAVSGAFHSPLMAEAADEFGRFLKRLAWKAPAFPVYHNATARPEASAAGVEARVTGQMTASVLWIDTMAAMRDAGIGRFVEVGPKGVLTKLAAANVEGAEAVNVGSLAQAEAFAPDQA